MKITRSIIITLIFTVGIVYLLLKETEKAEKTEIPVKEEMKDTNWYSFLSAGDVIPEEPSQKNYYIIFDGSGSMAGRKIQDAKTALRKFIRLIPERANIGLLAFDKNGASERAELGSDKQTILQRVDKISAGKSTPLGESTEIAVRKLAMQAKKQLGYGEYNLIIITDGEATDLSRLNTAVDAVLKNTPIVIYTIGFHIGTGHALNQPGKIYYKTAKNVEELSQGLKQVLAESENFTVTKFK